MAARAIWKGTIRCGEIHLPVKLYSMVVDRTVRFHLLHDLDHERLKQRMVDPATEESVPLDKARKGYEVERGVFVVVTQPELDSLQPEESRDILVTRFVERQEVQFESYERPYYLGPDGDATEYSAFATALARQNYVGVAHWTMRGKQYIGALQSEDGVLVLITLRLSALVQRPTGLAAPPGGPISEKERELGRQLIGMLEEDFDPEDYHDEYQQQVSRLIDAKRKGKKLHRRGYRPTRRTASLARSLEASLKKA